MPYKDPERQNAYWRDRAKNRRAKNIALGLRHDGKPRVRPYFTRNQENKDLDEIALKDPLVAQGRKP